MDALTAFGLCAVAGGVAALDSDYAISFIRQLRRRHNRLRSAGIWVEPTLLAEIEYRAKSAEGKVRHPVFKGLREDL